MSKAPPPNGPLVWPSLLTALVGAVTAAMLFHAIDHRGPAAAIVPIALVWGGLVVGWTRTGASLTACVGIALALRLPLVGTEPWLSDDLHRYLFEGRALLAGHNPFLTPPADLAFLDPVLADRVNHPHLTSIYPPVAQLWFRALALVGSGAWVAQLATAVVDTANVAALHRLRARDGQETWPALLYALHPLPVLESAHGAHLEPLGVLACLGVLLALPRRPWLAVVPLVAGIGVKLLPVLFVPALWRRLGTWRTVTAGLLGTVALLGLATPLLVGSPDLTASFRTYSGWSHGALVAPLLRPVTGDATRVVLGALGLGVAITAATRRDARWTWWITATGFLVLSPTVHPWYALWALPASLVLGRRDWALGALGLQVGYLVLATFDATGAWHPPGWLTPLTWLLVFAGFAYARRLDSPTVP